MLETLGYMILGTLTAFLFGAGFAFAFVIVKKVIETYLAYIGNLQNKKYQIKEIQNTLYYAKGLLEKTHPDNSSVQRRINILDHLINEIKRRDEIQENQALKKETLKRLIPFLEKAKTHLKEIVKIMLEFLIKNLYTTIEFCKKKWSGLKRK